MPWYVFALVDQPPPSRPGRGLAGPLAPRMVPGGFAIVERRADVPPPEFGTLKTHQAVVTRIAEAVPAILPVRFGTLLEIEEIEEALQEREQEIADAFALVRGRVQFTWRRPRSNVRRPKSAPTSGAEFLRRAAGKGKPPAAFKTIRKTLQLLVSGERYQSATPSIPESLYHLVNRTDQERYRRAAGKLAVSSPALRLTGPFPPFAFCPDLL